MRQYVSYLLPYRTYILLNIGCNILSVLFSLVSLTMVMPFLQLLFDKTKPVSTLPEFSWSVAWVANYFNYWFSQAILLYGKQGALWRVCVLVAVVFLLKNLFRFFAAYYMAYLRNGVVRDVRAELFNKMLLLPLSYFSEERKGDLTVRLTTDVQEIEQSIIAVIEVTIREPLTIICYLGAMLFISPTLSIIVLLVLPLTGFAIARIGSSLKRKSHQAQGRLSMLLSIIDESLSGLRIIKGFTAEKKQTQYFAQENNAYTNLMTSILRRRELASPLSEFLSISVVSLLLYIGGVMVLNNAAGLSADTFIGFMLIFSQLIPPAKSLSTAFFQIQKGIASIERIEEVLNAPLVISDLPDAVEHAHFTTAIEYRQVSFLYNKNKKGVDKELFDIIQQKSIAHNNNQLNNTTDENTNNCPSSDYNYQLNDPIFSLNQQENSQISPEKENSDTNHPNTLEYETPNPSNLLGENSGNDKNVVQSVVEQRTSIANKKLVLSNISLHIPKGHVVALVGASGAGKTTLADLLPRFYDPTMGEIFIDGVPIQKIKLQSLRQLIGIVSQEAILFNDTVRQNIVFGMEISVTQAQIETAAKIANAHDFIMQLEKGYDTIIGDRGNKLSGGEKQRLTIARAVLKNPPILILDEATSALDTESERAVQDALTKLMRHRTTIVIAHRLSTIKAADEIVVLEQGRIVERGTHEVLLQLNGVYSKLIK